MFRAPLVDMPLELNRYFFLKRFVETADWGRHIVPPNPPSLDEAYKGATEGSPLFFTELCLLDAVFLAAKRFSFLTF